MPRCCLLPACILALGSCVWTARAPSAQESLPPARSAQSALIAKFELQGAGSCAAQACHNSDALTGSHGREYRIALERDFTTELPRVKDKHAQAYAVLFEERSLRMLRQWKGQPAGSPVHPEREALCLRCHVHRDYGQHAVRVEQGVPQFRLEDGVSCEACHGPAEQWLATHFRPGFQELSAEARKAQGMFDTRSVAGRVGICVDCHVGQGSAEVNHDLIAAGHPRLNFEFGGFQHELHKHWDIAKDNDPARDPRGRKDFEARSWAVGQIVAAETALRLLADRAGDERRPWIEFAEYNCFACHHDLQPNSWRHKNYLKGQAGKLTWSPWYYAMLDEAVEALGPGAANLTAPLRLITTEMESPVIRRGLRFEIATRRRRWPGKRRLCSRPFGNARQRRRRCCRSPHFSRGRWIVLIQKRRQAGIT